jgi:tetratricopeptide (TPR) repeat protein
MTYNIGLLHYRMESYSEAAEYFTTALEDGISPIYYFQRGLSYYRQKLYAEARSDFSSAIKFGYTPLSSAYYYRGLTAYHQDDYSYAISDYTTALDGDYLHIDAVYRERCLAYYHTSQYDLAIQDCSNAVVIKPEDAVSYLYRGLSKWRTAGSDSLSENELSGILDDLNAALTLRSDDLSDPLLPIILYNRALLYYESENYPNAQVDLDLLIKIQPQHSGAYYYSGLIAYKSGEYQAAVDALTQSLSIEPDRAWALYYRGMAYRRLGLYDLAVADFQVVLNDAPGTRAAKLASQMLIKMREP